MRTRRFHGIKTRSIVISHGYALVLGLALALAASSLTALIALTVLIVSDALTVLDAEAAVAGAAEAVAADTSPIDMKKGKPLTMQGLFIWGQTYETNPNT
ncbi:hypothetical protein ABE26_02655 [Cytobacillus firmus]|nr:hypothetical protein [Cytobacillus firmus]